MVARSPQISHSENSFYTRVELGEVTVTLNDTVTFSEFDSTSTIWQVFLFNKSNGVQVTCSTALNVATITQAGALNYPCFYVAYGVKA